MPQQLSLLDPPAPDPGVWARVDDAHRALVIEALTRLLAKAAVASQASEATHD